MDRLTEIEARWADVGEWQHTGAGNVYMQDKEWHVGFTSGSLSLADTIAATPEDIAWLIAEVKKLRMAYEALRRVWTENY